MKRLTGILAVFGGASLSACGGGEVIVLAQLEGEGGEPVAIQELPVRALPFDRDIVFDSIDAAAATPQPPIPDSLLTLQGEIAEANSTWQTTQLRWNTARDTLRTISDRLRSLNRGSAEYTLLFRTFGQMEAQERATRQQMDAAFQRFNDLQNRYATMSGQVRVARANWADETYVSVDSIFAVRLEALDREEATDTTDASGVARFESLAPGEWWIVAHYDLPYEELYWNLPVTVERGDPIQVILNRANAEKRPKL